MGSKKVSHSDSSIINFTNDNIIIGGEIEDKASKQDFPDTEISKEVISNTSACI